MIRCDGSFVEIKASSLIDMLSEMVVVCTAISHTIQQTEDIDHKEEFIRELQEIIGGKTTKEVADEHLEETKQRLHDLVDSIADLLNKKED